MPDSEVTSFTESTSPALSDLLYLTDSGGTIDRKVQVSNLLAAGSLFFLGSARVNTNETTTSATYGDLATVGPDVTFVAPASGKVLILFGADIYTSSSPRYSAMSFEIVADPSGSPSTFLAASDTHGITNSTADPNKNNTCSHHEYITGLTPGTTYRVRAKYSGEATFTSNFRRRIVTVLG